MREKSGSRLWPLALMGWLAAYPPADQDNALSAIPAVEDQDGDHLVTRLGEGQRTAWLRAARARYAALPVEERRRLRAERRA
ncbi:hypothetical protein NON00_13575 [Roseomonas sp. GC11]|uniref:hypothetical protein n=1 Tax=Roseomonas sp. GC11 TaxID=2950546 RepID=UPI002109F9E5|nr:hypothetical protein [Roseomonas sp. GC11]MCQ4160959.1 hypothetical protein [Roseomonas sp. GC11]